MYRRHPFGASDKTRRAMLNKEHRNILMMGAAVIPAYLASASWAGRYDGADAQSRTDAIVTEHGHIPTCPFGGTRDVLYSC